MAEMEQGLQIPLKRNAPSMEDKIASTVPRLGMLWNINAKNVNSNAGQVNGKSTRNGGRAKTFFTEPTKTNRGELIFILLAVCGTRVVFLCGSSGAFNQPNLIVCSPTSFDFFCHLLVLVCIASPYIEPPYT